ncbi:MAG: transposase [Patescibacteria group bacterium UBA2163]
MILKLSNKQWDIIKPLIPKISTLETRGRKRKDEKHVFEMCLFMFVFGSTSGYTWRDLNYPGAPSFQTCNRRYHEWNDCGLFYNVIEVLARDLENRGNTKLRSCFKDKLYAKGYFLFLEQDFNATDTKDWIGHTKDFFESINVWELLLKSKSKWVQARLPDDLYNRVHHPYF